MVTRKARECWRLLTCVIGMIALVGCAGLGGSRENLRFSAKIQPKFVQGFPGQGYESTRLVLTGDSISQWTEALETITTTRKSHPPSVEAAYKCLMDMGKKKCPDFTSNVISQDQNTILFEMHTGNCPPNVDEHSLARILYGSTNVFSLIYINTVKELPPEKREEWIKYLSEASIASEK